MLQREAALEMKIDPRVPQPRGVAGTKPAPKTEYFEPFMQELHRPNRGSFSQFGRRNHDSRKIHLGVIFIGWSGGLGAV
jgi:hypothetical protein